MFCRFFFLIINEIDFQISFFLLKQALLKDFKFFVRHSDQVQTF